MSDLPEPRRISSLGVSLADRRWRLLGALLWLTALYATLHKAIVPVFLKFTSLHESPHAQVNLWFVHPLWLAWEVRGRAAVTALSSFLAGVGIAYGAVSLLKVAEGKAVGWLAFSSLLAALPVAGVCIGLLSGPFEGKRPLWAWAGVGSVLLWDLAWRLV